MKNPVPSVSTNSIFDPESVNCVDKLFTRIVEEAKKETKKNLSNAVGGG